MKFFLSVGWQSLSRIRSRSEVNLRITIFLVPVRYRTT